ncbi:MAG: histidine kinase dimerization/phospho-acceptor domain-containing protein [Nitrospirota bacterium]
MEILALLSNRDEIIDEVKSILGKYTIYPLRTVEELEDLYSNIPLNLLLIDTVSHQLSHLEDFLGILDNGKALLLVADKPAVSGPASLPESVYDSISIESLREGLPVMVERAIEKQKLQSEVRLLLQSRNRAASMPEQVYERKKSDRVTGSADPVSGGRYPQEKIIVNFAKMLSVNFDMQKLFDHFVDSVMEIARVSRMSVMLKDKDGFRVKTDYGLDPVIAGNLMLALDSELVQSLKRTGRIIHKPVAFNDSKSIRIGNEMDLLQCVVSFPMMYKGKLIGIFNIDTKITEEPFYIEELEIIYVLCNYLAAAVKDIDLYHKMWYQKEFTNNLISSMSSGMIAIDRGGKVTIFNQQASDILKLEPDSMKGHDLKDLPSPLGDLLYETMLKGTSYKRHEVVVSSPALPLGINSYRLLDEHRKPIGAGIIFSDLSDSRKIKEQKKMADDLKMVNNLIAKIAHEVRNPLTSIQTYTQLLNEKFTDDELKNFFISTVSQSIKKLDILIDKLVAFSSTQDYNFGKEDLNELMTGIADFISRNIPDTHRFFMKLSNRPFHVNADKKQLTKAVYYLALNIIDKTPDGTSMKMTINVRDDDIPYADIAIKYSGGIPMEGEDQEQLRPLPAFDNLGSELNIPICHKIIKGHGGTLDIRSEDSLNIFIISLPVFYSGNDTLSVKGGLIRGQYGENSCN